MMNEQNNEEILKMITVLGERRMVGVLRAQTGKGKASRNISLFTKNKRYREVSPKGLVTLKGKTKDRAETLHIRKDLKIFFPV